MKASEAKKTLQRQYKRQNEYIKNNYDKTSITLPRGTKDRIKAVTGKSVNGYIRDLILADLARLEAEAGEQ